jgi:hypothetical protein
MQEEVVAAVGKGSMLAEDDALPSDAEDDAEACGGPEVTSVQSRGQAPAAA